MTIALGPIERLLHRHQSGRRRFGRPLHAMRSAVTCASVCRLELEAAPTCCAHVRMTLTFAISPQSEPAHRLRQCDELRPGYHERYPSHLRTRHSRAAVDIRSRRPQLETRLHEEMRSTCLATAQVGPRRPLGESLSSSQRSPSTGAFLVERKVSHELRNPLSRPTAPVRRIGPTL